MNQPINIIGFSQGSLISRGVVEACPDIKVRKLITYGGPHGGVSSIYACRESTICWIVNFLAKQLVYLDIVQYAVAPAEYFRVFTNLPDYLAHSFFLPYLNNE